MIGIKYEEVLGSIINCKGLALDERAQSLEIFHFLPFLAFILFDV